MLSHLHSNGAISREEWESRNLECSSAFVREESTVSISSQLISSTKKASISASKIVKSSLIRKNVFSVPKSCLLYHLGQRCEIFIFFRARYWRGSLTQENLEACLVTLKGKTSYWETKFTLKSLRCNISQRSSFYREGWKPKIYHYIFVYWYANNNIFLNCLRNMKL